MNSPRQKLAINSERNVQNPEGVKIGCDHQSQNGFRVQPSNCIFEAAPVRSPKLDFVQKIQAPMRTAAEQESAASAGIASRNRDRDREQHECAMATAATKMSGKLLSFVR